MSKPANKALIGGFVVGAVALVIAGVLIFGSGKFLQETAKSVMYFDGSVKGLSVGSPVVFRGVKIGTVTDILLQYNPADMSVKIPVIIELELDRIENVGEMPRKRDPWKTARQLIERGLRAQLQTQSLVTGQLMIELDFHPDKPIKLVGGHTEYPEIPTIPSPLKELSKKIEKVPIEEIFEKLLAAVGGIEEIVNSPEVKGIISSLNQAAEDASKLVKNLNAQVTPLVSSIEKALGDTRKLVRNVNSQVQPVASSIEKSLEEVRAALEQGRKTLVQAEDVIGEDSPLMYELDNTLKEVGAAARSIRLLADYLKRHPEALLKGKGSSGGE